MALGDVLDPDREVAVADGLERGEAEVARGADVERVLRLRGAVRADRSREPAAIGGVEQEAFFAVAREIGRGALVVELGDDVRREAVDPCRGRRRGGLGRRDLGVRRFRRRRRRRAARRERAGEEGETRGTGGEPTHGVAIYPAD